MTRLPPHDGRRHLRQRPPSVPRLQSEDGSAGFTFIFLLWLTVVAGVAIVDVGAYLVAAARAQQLADAGALAAVSVDAEVGGGSPVDAARRVVEVAGEGRIEHCACARRSEEATVTVSVPVHGVFIPRKGWATRVTAEASAELVDARPP